MSKVIIAGSHLCIFERHELLTFSLRKQQKKLYLFSLHKTLEQWPAFPEKLIFIVSSYLETIANLEQR